MGFLIRTACMGRSTAFGRKIVVAKGSQTDWIPGAENSIVVKTYADKSKFLSCTGAPGGSSATLPPILPPQLLPPVAPSSISHSCIASGTAATFSWPSVTGATTYWLFIKNIGSCPSGWTADTKAPGTCYKSSMIGTSATFSGITPGTNYEGWVFAENAAGINWNSYATTDWFSCAPPVPQTLPVAPASISYSCSAGGTSVTFSWPSASDATAYWPFIKKVTSCASGWTPDTNAPGTCYKTSITSTPATSSGITPGTSYTGWVVAENGAGVNWNSYPNTGWFSCSAG